jgi:hypothetical protein
MTRDSGERHRSDRSATRQHLTQSVAAIAGLALVMVDGTLHDDLPAPNGGVLPNSNFRHRVLNMANNPLG